MNKTDSIPYFTVYTATYNRAHTLSLVFESLKKQSFKDFEWLIIDDGSTDGTDKLVERFAEEAEFPIRYFWKENGGGHTARNYSYPLIKAKYTISMDSDDMFEENALKKVHDIWESIPEEEYSRFWQISGRCRDARTGRMIGKRYPAGINKLKGRKQNIARHKCNGEKSCCRKTDILRKFPFTEYKDVKFVSEDSIWEQIDELYDTFCTNEILRIYETESPDSIGLGRGHPLSYRRTQWYWSVFAVNKLLSHWHFDNRVIVALLNLPRLTWLSGTKYSELMKSIDGIGRKALILLVTPLSWLVMKVHDRKNEDTT